MQKTKGEVVYGPVTFKCRTKGDTLYLPLFDKKGKIVYEAAYMF
jgi:hypothetical protein